MGSYEDDMAELDALAEAIHGPLPGAAGRAQETSAREARDGELIGLFRQVGLSEAAAQDAASGLRGGVYFSFEDAALSASDAFDFQRGRFIDYPRLRGIAERLERRGGQIVAERRSAVQSRPRVVESGRGTVTGNGTLSIVIIDAGQGSSGYYPAATLEAAGRARVFGQGLQMFLDHPTATEEYDRPERSVRDLAGVLASDAWYDRSDQALKATATVFPAFRESITEMASHIGLSIRAEASVGHTADGPVVQEITRALSVDFVTAAGRGGRIVSAS